MGFLRSHKQLEKKKPAGLPQDLLINLPLRIKNAEQQPSLEDKKEIQN